MEQQGVPVCLYSDDHMNSSSIKSFPGEFIETGEVSRVFHNHNQGSLTSIAILVVFIGFSTYLSTLFNARFPFRKRTRAVLPSIAPYWIPLIAHSLSFLWDTPGIVEWASNYYGDHTPLSLRFLGLEMTFVSGRENVASIWKNSRELGSKEGVCMIMEMVFMSPKKTMRFYRADNSGVNIRPHPDSSIKQEHRIYYHNFRTTHDFLTGQGLRKFAYRMQANLRTMVSKTEASSQWTEYKDLYVFVQQLLFPAAVEAMCGPVLLSLSPTFTSDFWEFDNHFPFFFKKYPRWLIPKGFRARDRLLQAVKSWLTYAHANFDQSMVSADGDWDPLFGSQFIRSRQDYCGKMADMSENAIASSELGMIWATNANSIPSAFWLLLEIIHDPELLERARHEVDQCHSSLSSPGNLDFDIDQLCKSPLLQSIYAETLRVYVAVFPIRTPEYKDFTLNNVLLKKDKLVAISSSVAHRDPTVWNTGRDNCHPLDTFSPERFLIYPDDEASGPLLKARKQELAPIQADTKEGPTFSLDGLSSSWIPYGGGQRMCPGRHFAKQEILLCFAVLVSSFDMKLRNSRKPSTDGRFYGLGALPPKEASPFLIRRRQA